MVLKSALCEIDFGQKMQYVSLVYLGVLLAKRPDMGISNHFFWKVHVYLSKRFFKPI